MNTMETNPIHIVGVDLAKRKFDVCLLKDGKTLRRTMTNDAKGARQLLVWLASEGCEAARTRVAMEATGCYGRTLSLYLHAQGVVLHVVNPAWIAHHGGAKGRRTKTDKADAALIADYCRVNAQKLHPWAPPSAAIDLLRQLLMRRAQLTESAVVESNQREALVDRALVRDSLAHEMSIKRRIAKLDERIDRTIGEDARLAREREHLMEIKGVKKHTAAELICHVHLHGYDNARACAAQTGLTPTHHESGDSVHKPSRITRMGDSHIRAALYMPAMGMRQHDPHACAWVDALVARGKKPMSALCALMRKLSAIAYGIIRHDAHYDPKLAFPGVSPT